VSQAFRSPRVVCRLCLVNAPVNLGSEPGRHQVVRVQRPARPSSTPRGTSLRQWIEVFRWPRRYHPAAMMAHTSRSRASGRYGFNRTIAHPCVSASSTPLRCVDAVTSNVGSSPCARRASADCTTPRQTHGQRKPDRLSADGHRHSPGKRSRSPCSETGRTVRCCQMASVSFTNEDES
jgi:hypothetical protein